MPSASAKVEKIASYEAADPVKQILITVEKKIRNVEKRKLKLDNYRLDVANGKELNEDQKKAVNNYEIVVSNLEFGKELKGLISSVASDWSRHNKKWAKKEQLERQQHEIQRLQEAFIYNHILSCFQNEDVRSDFLNGENGAVQLTSEQLSQLDQMYKLMAPGIPTERADHANHFHYLAENYFFLAEGKNKEVVGTTYKDLKELLQSIRASGYFTRPSEPVEEDSTSSEDLPEDEIAVEKSEQNQENVTVEDSSIDEQPACIEQCEDDKNVEFPKPAEIVLPINDGSQLQNGPLQDVLCTQGTFNFLQESQIDLDAPHMDPAVVAVHQIAPPPAVNFAGNTYTASPPLEKNPTVSGIEVSDVSPQPPLISQVPIIPAAIPRTVTPVLSSVQLNSQQEFDPSHPIPTQTFTNQSFAVMQNMIMPQGYVPVTVHHGTIPPHIAPIAVVPGLSPPVTTVSASVVPVHVPVAPVSVAPAEITQNETEPKNEVEEIQQPCDEEASPSDMDSSSNQIAEKNGENGYTSSYRGGGGFRRGRGRGNNNYYRGRGNYNGRGGGFQNHYYQDRNGYNGNYRRGNNRGARGNGNNRGRGNYRTQQGSPAQQQQREEQQTQQ